MIAESFVQLCYTHVPLSVIERISGGIKGEGSSHPPPCSPNSTMYLPLSRSVRGPFDVQKTDEDKCCRLIIDGMATQIFQNWGGSSHAPIDHRPKIYIRNYWYKFQHKLARLFLLGRGRKPMKGNR
jgi:hypothetical protein